MLWPLCSEPFCGKLILTRPLTQFPSIASLFHLSGFSPPPCSWSSPGSTSELFCNVVHILLALHPSVLLTLLSGLIASHSTHTPSTPLFLSVPCWLPGTATE